MAWLARRDGRPCSPRRSSSPRPDGGEPRTPRGPTPWGGSRRSRGLDLARHRARGAAAAVHPALRCSPGRPVPPVRGRRPAAAEVAGRRGHRRRGDLPLRTSSCPCWSTRSAPRDGPPAWPRRARLPVPAVVRAAAPRDRGRRPAAPALRHRRRHQAGPWSTACSPRPWSWSTSARCSCSKKLLSPLTEQSGPRGGGLHPGRGRAVRPGTSPDPAARWTVASTAAATTPPSSSTGSRHGCATSWTSTPSATSWCPSWSGPLEPDGTSPVVPAVTLAGRWWPRKGRTRRRLTADPPPVGSSAASSPAPAPAPSRSAPRRPPQATAPRRGRSGTGCRAIDIAPDDPLLALPRRC